MREINTHRVEGMNHHTSVVVTDEPGSGGAHHDYEIHLLCGPGEGKGITSERMSQKISFQNGPIAEAGVNGVTHENLLAIVIDRLECFQRGPFACRENALALTKLQESLMWLQKRTQGANNGNE